MKMINDAHHIQLLPNGTPCISAFPYLDFFKESMLRYKYGNCRQYYKAFAITLSKLVSYAPVDTPFDVYTSVPVKHALPGNRFDQAKLLAQSTAKRSGSVYESLLLKTKFTGFQHDLSAKERAENVVGLYRSRDGANIEGRSILIFDDVVTTGSTLSACSDALLSSGAKSVCSITLLY